MVNIRLAPLLGASTGLIDAAVNGGSWRGFAIRLLSNYTGYQLDLNKFEVAGLMRGVVPALVGAGVSFGAKMFGFQGNIVRTKKFKLSAF